MMITGEGPGGRLGRWGRPMTRLAVLLAVAVLVGCQTAPAHAAPAKRRHNTVPACAIPAPTTAAGYTAAFDQLPDAAWYASDGFDTIPLPGGRVLWTSGDTIRTGGMIHSSFVVQQAGCFHALPTQPIPNAADGSVYWPLSGLVEHGHLAVALGHVQPLATGGWSDLGLSVATFTLPTGGDPVWASTVDVPQPGGVSWGAAVQHSGTFTYVFGSKAGAWFGDGVRLARYPATGSLTAPAGWQFWTGTAWTSDPTATAEIIPSGATGTEAAFSVQQDGSTWTVVSKANGPWGSTITAWTAAGVAGPYTPTSIAPGYTPAGQVSWYNTHAHPAAVLASGLELVSIARTDDPATLWTDPSKHRPLFLEMAVR